MRAGRTGGGEMLALPLLCSEEAWAHRERHHLLAPHSLQRLVVLAQSLNSCSTWDSGLCALTGQHSGAGSGVMCVGEPALRVGIPGLPPGNGSIG